MSTALSWIPKRASKAMPNASESSSKEEIKELMIQNDTFKKSDMDENEEMDVEIQNSEVTHAQSVAKLFGKSCSKDNGVSSSSSSSRDPDDVDKLLKELDMDNYDEEDDACRVGYEITTTKVKSHLKEPLIVTTM